MPAGVVTVSERFGGVEVDAGELSRPCATICGRMLGEFAERVRARDRRRARCPIHLLGTSGTVTTIAGVQMGLARYDRSRVDGCWLDSDGDRRGHRRGCWP